MDKLSFLPGLWKTYSPRSCFLRGYKPGVWITPFLSVASSTRSRKYKYSSLAVITPSPGGLPSFPGGLESAAPSKASIKAAAKGE